MAGTNLPTSNGGAGNIRSEGMKPILGVLARVPNQTLLQIIVVLAATVAMKFYQLYI